MPLTVGQLREMLSQYPDGMPIVMSVHYREPSGAPAGVRDYNVDDVSPLYPGGNPELGGWLHLSGHSDEGSPVSGV